MLNVDELRQVTTIVSHEQCADGVAASLILRDVLPEARVVFVQYNTPAYRDLSAVPHMLFCDMTPPPDRVQEFVDAGAIVLDHHAGARELVASFGERGVFADEREDPGMSGAVLAYQVWRELSPNWIDARPSPHREWHPDPQYSEATRHFAALAGIRDTWQRQDPRWRKACAQAAALRFWPAQLLLNEGLRSVIEHRFDIGEILLQRDEERDTKTIAEAFRFRVKDLHVVAFEGLYTSDIADRLAEEADLVMGWHFIKDPELGSRVVVSCRTRGSAIVALEFAKHYGGGGHAGAAGFNIEAPCDMGPYALMHHIVDSYVFGPPSRLARAAYATYHGAA